jgi:dTDP-6-deoxy-L-talose 4-dehydrogenase (NAD+)
MNVLVTGATGFIGEAIIPILVSEGYSVTATSRNIEKAKKQTWFESVDFKEFSIGSNSNEDIYSYFNKPDIVIHTAWDKLHDYKGLHHIEENVMKHYFFLKELIANGTKNVNVLGTCFEYGMKEGQLNENMPSEPTNPYGLAKNTLRIFLEALSIQHPFNLKWIRLFYSFGKASNSNSIYAQLIHAIQRKDEYFNMSKGDQLRDFMDFDEMIHKIIKISIQDKVTGIINCCSGKPTRVLELIEHVALHHKSSIKLNTAFYPYSPLEPMHFWGDTEKLNRI